MLLCQMFMTRPTQHGGTAASLSIPLHSHGTTIVSHALLIGGYSALGPATLALRADGPPRTALLTTLGSAGVLLSLPTVFGQLTLDLVAAHGAATQQDMDAFFGRVFATPALAVPCYRVGPPCSLSAWRCRRSA